MVSSKWAVKVSVMLSWGANMPLVVGGGSEEEEEEEVGRKVKTFAKTKVVKMENGKWKMENVNEHVYQ